MNHDSDSDRAWIVKLIKDEQRKDHFINSTQAQAAVPVVAAVVEMEE